jgi:hypothetical protein
MTRCAGEPLADFGGVFDQHSRRLLGQVVRGWCAAAGYYRRGPTRHVGELTPAAASWLYALSGHTRRIEDGLHGAHQATAFW